MFLPTSPPSVVKHVSCSSLLCSGVSQLQLHETFAELLVPAVRRKFRRHLEAFVESLTERWKNCPLPPLFVCDVYIHRKADGTEICR